MQTCTHLIKCFKQTCTHLIQCFIQTCTHLIKCFMQTCTHLQVLQRRVAAHHAVAAAGAGCGSVPPRSRGRSTWAQAHCNKTTTMITMTTLDCQVWSSMSSLVVKMFASRFVTVCHGWGVSRLGQSNAYMQ